MIAPIGSFLTYVDGVLSGSMDSIIASMTSAMAAPVALAAVCYYGVQGLKLANGDASPLQNFVPQLIRVGMVIYLSSNLDGFNQWVRGIFFTGLPNALAAAVAGATGGIGGTGAAASSVGGTAAVFDALWAQMWAVIGTIWMSVGWSVMGAVAAAAGVLASIFCGLGLISMALVYISARLVLGVVVCLAPVIIGCAMFDATKPIFERAVGKVVALILLQTIGLIVLQIILNGNQMMMAKATTASLSAMSNVAAMPDAIQLLCSLIVWFFAGAVAMFALPSVAYSIGAGVMMPGPSAYTMAALARMMPSFGGGGMAGAASAGGGGPAPSLNISLAQAELPRGGALALPPPPPPAITHSTRR